MPKICGLACRPSTRASLDHICVHALCCIICMARSSDIMRAVWAGRCQHLRYCQGPVHCMLQDCSRSCKSCSFAETSSAIASEPLTAYASHQTQEKPTGLRPRHRTLPWSGLGQCHCHPDCRILAGEFPITTTDQATTKFASIL